MVAAITDSEIIKLIGTTKATIQKIRERSHWNATNIKAVDPVTLGLCSQRELDAIVARAAKSAGIGAPLRVKLSVGFSFVIARTSDG